MRNAFAVSALLAIAGSSYGFIVRQVAIQPNQSITPSSGAFVNVYSGFAHGGGAGLVTNAYATWNSYGALVRGTTWFGLDRWGGGGNFYGKTTDPPGPPAPIPCPEFAGSNGNTLGVPGIGTADPAPSIQGGTGGVNYTASSAFGFMAPSAVSPVNGVSKDSIFFANFAMTDPNATLTGAPLLVTIEQVNYFLPLDGSKGASSGNYRIEYEDAGDGVRRAFVVYEVPAPGAMGVAGLTGLVALRRRRR